MRGAAFLEPALVAAKELKQLSNRNRFHIEKFAFVGTLAVVFAGMAFAATDVVMIPADMASFGRSSFFWVSVSACVMLSLFALAAASGVIMSEQAGKRLDILRITPFSLRTIVLGKGVSILMKSLLVLALISPVLAAAQFYGGVSMSDVGQVVCIMFGDVLFCTGLGLFVSAGAQSNLDRAFRGGALVAAWLVITGVGFAGLAPLAPMWLTATSPLSVWFALMSGFLPWHAALLNVVIMSAVGVGFAAASVPVLRRTVRRAEERVAEPKVRDFLGGIGRIRARGGRGKLRPRQRNWVGTLIGNECLQTSALPIALPLAVGVPPAVVMAVYSLSRIRNFRDEDVLFLASALTVVLAAMIALQACAAIAREKQRHTAEVLASTPVGGARMLVWKSAAVFITQAMAIGLCLALLLKPSILRYHSATFVTARLLGFAALVIFGWAAGISCSAVTRTPFGAVGLLGLSFCILAPLAASMLGYLQWRSSAGYRTTAFNLAGWGVMVAAPCVAAVLVFFRQRFRRAAAALLGAGLALALSCLPIVDTAGRERAGVNHFEYMARIFGESRFREDEALSAALALLALSVLLAGGACLWFTRVFLHGARPRE